MIKVVNVGVCAKQIQIEEFVDLVLAVRDRVVFQKKKKNIFKRKQFLQNKSCYVDQI